MTQRHDFIMRLAWVANTLMKRTYAPWATIETGTAVEKGTTVFLFCATPNATIYYTTDGSCPCDENKRKQYNPDEGITIDNDITIRTLAVAENMLESESIEFVYKVNANTGISNIQDKNKIFITPHILSDGNENVSVFFDVDTESALIEVFDISGGKILRKRVANGGMVSFAGKSKGIYVVSVNISGKRHAVKIIKTF